MSYFSCLLLCHRRVKRLRDRCGPSAARFRPIVEELEERVVPTLLGQTLFPADNAWNQDIANAPVAGNSTTIVNALTGGGNATVKADFFQDPPSYPTNNLYGIPYNIVHGNSVPKVSVVIDTYPGESDIVAAPIVSGVVLEGDYVNGPSPSPVRIAENSDSHLIIWDEDNNIDYEFWHVTRPNEPTYAGTNPQDGMWHAAQETVWNMNTDTFRTLGYTSADAAGLAILAGLARPDEGLPTNQGGQGAIDHALRFTLDQADAQFLYPAEHIVTGQGGSLPMGARFRLKSSVNISTLDPESQIIARALQTYGMILADIGSNFYISGADYAVDANNNKTVTWQDSDLEDPAHGLDSIPFSDFELVNLTPVVTSLSTNSAAAGTLVTITGLNFSGAAGHLSVLFGTTASSSVTVVNDSTVQAVVPAGSGTVNIRVQSGVPATTTTATFTPTDNANDPIFGYGTSAIVTADQFTYNEGGIDVLPATLPNWTVNKAGYNTTVSAGGGSAPYTFTVSLGSLPTGLSLNGTTGAITGTPTVTGAFAFTIKATDKTSAAGTNSYLVTINPVPTLTTTSLASGTVNQSGYSQVLTTTGGTGALMFALTVGSLPTGLILNPATGAITGTPTVAGTFKFTISVTDAVGDSTSKAQSIVINAAAASPPPSSSPSGSSPSPSGSSSAAGSSGFPPSIIATGADAGGGPQITVYNANTATVQSTFYGLPPNFTGGARVALGDVNGDGVLDYVVAAGPGAAPQITVFDGRTLQPIRSFYALSPTFTGGAFVACGDVNGDGYADIIVSADRGGGPQVTIWSGKDGSLLASFYATTPTFTGGIRIAAADINGDGFADVIAVAGPGGGPQVTIFDGKTMSVVKTFYGMAPTFTGGLYVAAGDVNGDGKADIVVGAGAGGGPQVTVFDGPTLTLLQSFNALAPGFTGGVRVAVTDVNGTEAIVASAGPGGGPQVAIFDSSTLALLDSFYATTPSFTGGIFVA